MLRIGEMWRKTNEHKEDRMHNSPCIPGDDRINGGMITATEAILQTAGSGSMEMGMGQRKVIISIIMAGC